MPSTFIHTTACALVLVSAGLTHVACAESADRLAGPAKQIVGVWCVSNASQSMGPVTFDFRKNGVLIARWREKDQTPADAWRVQTARWSTSGRSIKIWCHDDTESGPANWTANITVDGNKFNGTIGSTAKTPEATPVSGKRSFSQYLR